MVKRWQKILAVGILAAVVEKWLLMSWFRWPDFVTDFGRELYIPWRISQGDPLYNDASYLFGPLSYYFNAFVFYLFGPSLTALVCVNLLVIVLLSVLVFVLLRFLGGFWTAFAGLLVFLGIFAFGHYTIYGNYNFVCPYAHQLTHGLVLSFLAFWLFKQWFLKPSWFLLPAIGLLWMLVFFTKFEVFLALSIALFSAFTVHAIFVARSVRVFARKVLPVLGFVLAAAVFLVFTFSSWVRILEPVLLRYWKIGFKSLGSGFYGNLSGFDKPAANLWLVLQSTAAYLLLILALGLIAVFISRIFSRSLRYKIVGLCAAALIIAGVLCKPDLWWLEERALPVVLIFAAVIFLLRLVRRGLSKINEARALLWITLSVFSLVLLIKIFLNVHVYHYGFALSMPGAVLAAGLAVRYLPLMGKGRLFRPWVFRFLLLAVLLAAVAGHMKWSRVYYPHKDCRIGEGRDAFYSWNPHAFATPYFFNMALQWLDKAAGPDDTLVVLPEGVMMNYLLRLRNPTGYLLLMPGDDEEKVLNSFEKEKPSYIVLLYRNMSEYHAGFFGEGYGKKVYQWILSNYTMVFHMQAPTQEGLEFVSILKKGRFTVDQRVNLNMDL